MPLRRLATVFGDYVRDDDTVFVKADTQGYESAVLDGAGAGHGAHRRLAARNVHRADLRRRDRLARSMLDRMERLGYAAHLFIPGYFSRHIARQLQIDGVFMRRQAG